MRLCGGACLTLASIALAPQEARAAEWRLEPKTPDAVTGARADDESAPEFDLPRVSVWECVRHFTIVFDFQNEERSV